MFTIRVKCNSRLCNSRNFIFKLMILDKKIQKYHCLHAGKLDSNNSIEGSFVLFVGILR